MNRVEVEKEVSRCVDEEESYDVVEGSLLAFEDGGEISFYEDNGAAGWVVWKGYRSLHVACGDVVGPAVYERLKLGGIWVVERFDVAVCYVHVDGVFVEDYFES